MKILRKIIAFGFLLLAVVQMQATILPPGFVEVELADKLDPTDFDIASDGRIFISEKKGTVRLVRDGKLLTTPFMEIEVDNTNERGLQSIVLHPDFETNQHFYLFYTVQGENINRVSRFTANGDRVVPGSEVVFYEMDRTIGTVHNGGAMMITQDRKLLFGQGDGGKNWYSQHNNKTMGKIMRLNLDGSIPDDNPKIYDGGIYDAVVAKGLRNPFNIAQAENGDIYINDVGGDNWEEINQLIFEKNYGWPFAEGESNDPNHPDDYENPIFAYDHDFGCAVVGGVFCPSDNMMFPDAYRGKYLFSDYCKGYIKVFDPEKNEIIGEFASEIDRPLRMNFDDQGRLFYLERAGLGGGGVGDNTQSSKGRLMMITFTGNGIPVISKDPGDQFLSVGEDAYFKVSANGAPTLNYEWYYNQVKVQEGMADTFVVSDVQLNQTGAEVYCIVSNTEGSDTSDLAFISVTSNTRPRPVIRILSDSPYVAGQTMKLEGFAEDIEDGQLSADQLTWKIDFHHDLHNHPAMASTNGTKSINYDIPRIGEIDDNVWYLIYLTATDGDGLSSTTIKDVFPKKVEITFTTAPTPVPINVDGLIVTPPTEIQSVVGISRSVLATRFYIAPDQAYLFDQWDGQGGDQQLTFDAPEQTTTFTASYDGYPYGEGVGLFGSYYDMQNRNPVYPADPVFTRVDSMIDFDWRKSPDSVNLGENEWLARWEGQIQPIISGRHHFGFTARSGVRLYVNNDLILEDWKDNPKTLFTSEDSIYLEAGKKYPILIEFFTFATVGTAELYWGNEVMRFQKVPKSQLYPERVPTNDPTKELMLEIIPNPFDANPKLRIQGHTGEVRIVVHDASGRQVMDKNVFLSTRATDHEMDFSALSDGSYVIQVFNSKGESAVRKVIKSGGH